MWRRKEDSDKREERRKKKERKEQVPGRSCEQQILIEPDCVWEESWWTDAARGRSHLGRRWGDGRVMRARRHGRRPHLGGDSFGRRHLSGGDGVTDWCRACYMAIGLKYTNNTLTVVVYLICGLTRRGSGCFFLGRLLIVRPAFCGVGPIEWARYCAFIWDFV